MTLVPTRKEPLKPIFPDKEKSRPEGGPKSEPSKVVPIWKGGAREGADDVFAAAGIKRRRSKVGLCSDVAQKEGFEPSHGVTRLLP